MLDWLVNWMTATLINRAVSILAISVIVSILMSIINRIFVDPEKMKAWTKEIKEWEEAYRKAVEAGDEKKISKLKKKEARIRELSSKMMIRYFGMMIVSMAILFIPFQMLIKLYGKMTVAILPIMNFPLKFIWWYWICSLALGTVFAKALRAW